MNFIESCYQILSLTNDTGLTVKEMLELYPDYMNFCNELYEDIKDEE